MFSIVCDGARLSRPPDVLQLQDDLQKFRILSGTSKNSERRPSVTLYTDECTGDQQSLQNNNIAAVKFYNGGDATHVLQFSLVCSNATTTLALMDPEAVSRPTMTRDDALKVLVKTKFVCCIYLFIISVLALIQIQCSTLDDVFFGLHPLTLILHGVFPEQILRKKTNSMMTEQQIQDSTNSRCKTQLWDAVAEL